MIIDCHKYNVAFEGGTWLQGVTDTGEDSKPSLLNKLGNEGSKKHAR
jgi:hypothetical protein